MSEVITILSALKKSGVSLMLDDSGLNLKLRGNLSSLSEETKQLLKVNKEQLIAFFKENSAHTNESIPVSDRTTSFGLAPNQKGIWFHEKVEELGTAYIIPAIYFYELADFNSSIFQQALNLLVQENDVFRLVFGEKEGEPYQQLLELVDLNLHSQIVTVYDHQELQDLITHKSTTSFHVDAPLWDITVYELPEASYCFYLRLHHLIGDGESLNVFIQQLIKTYLQLQAGETLLPANQLQYQDYVAWISTKENFTKATDFWKKEFAQYEEDFHLNTAKIGVDDSQSAGKTYMHSFSESLTASMREWAMNNRVSLASLYTAATGIVLSKRGNSADFVIGIPTASRNHPQLSTVIGNLVNTLPLRLSIDFTLDPKAYVLSIQQRYLAVLEHQLYPFQYILEDIDYQRKSDQHPLFNVMVSVPNNKAEKATEQEIELEKTTSLYDLTFTFIEGQDTIQLALEYVTAKFEKSRIERIAKEIERVAQQLVNESPSSLNAISLLSEQDKTLILETFNETTTVFPKEQTIIELFENQVKTSPNNIALVYQDTTITYSELNAKSNQLANYIRNNYDVQPNDLIGIKLERGQSMIIALLSVLKSGAAYVPIDLNYPEERKQYIQDNSNCKLIIDAVELSKFNAGSTSCSDENLMVDQTVNDLSYVIYTSGTTGKPKGILVENKQLLNYVQTFINYFNVTDTDSVLSQSTISFDTSIEEIFPILIVGGRLIIADDNRDFESLIQLCEKHQITILTTNPYTIHYLNDVYESYNLALRQIISGGDVLKMEYVANLYKNINIFNTYGPTETTVCATYYKLTDHTLDVPIGSPISNCKIYILNAHHQPVPIGVLGTIFIAGEGVSRGYLNNQILTDEKFIQNPFGGNSKMFDTGDVGSWLEDGTIVFTGRKDNQVNLRGFRIELEEIENVLLNFSENINNVVVSIQEMEGDKRLIAHYVTKKNIDKKELRNYLQDNLVYYMIPSYLKEIAEIPITLNGKIDYSKLPIGSEDDLLKEVYTGPQTELESQIVTIWQEILGVEKVGIYDDFFELGGHSLKITQLMSRYQTSFGAQLTIKSLFMHSTAVSHAQLIANHSQKSKENKIQPIAESDDYPASFAQQRMWILSQLEGGSRAYHMPTSMRLKGNLDLDKFIQSIETVIDKHESLRTVFHSTATGELRQKVVTKEALGFKVDLQDIRSTENQTAFIESFEKEHTEALFNLTSGPLVRVGIIILASEEFLFYYNMHHIISDGWSMDVLAKDVLSTYNAYLKGENIITSLPIQYKDYASWQKFQIENEIGLSDREYWSEKLSGELTVLDLPSQKLRPKVKSYNGSYIEFSFSKELTDQLTTFCRNEGGTLFMGLLAGLNSLLYRYTNQQDIIVGTPIAGRTNLELEDQIGLYVNTLALRTQFKGTDNFNTLFNRVKETTLGAYEHQLYPFDKLVNELELTRDLSRNPLFDIMLVMQNSTQDLNESDKKMVNDFVEVVYEASVGTTSQFDITFTFLKVNDGLSGSVEYNTDIYTPAFILQLTNHYESILKESLSAVNSAISDISYLSSQELSVLLDGSNSSLTDYKQQKTVIDFFEEQVAQFPTHSAVVYGEETLSYQELSSSIIAFATYLQQEKGVNPTNRVVCSLTKSTEQLVSMYATWMVGGIYVPIDSNLPEERKKRILADCNPTLVIDFSVIADYQSKRITIDTDFPTIQGNSISYILYTSGTTGTPKGVMISHSNLANKIQEEAELLAVSTASIMYTLTSTSFDVSFLETVLPLSKGGKVIIAPEEELKNTEHTIVSLSRNKVTHLQGTPTYFAHLITVLKIESAQELKHLAYICIGGESLNSYLVHELKAKLPHVQINNHYGPTEITIDALVKQDISNFTSNSIGQPIGNTFAHIVDESGNLVPIGVIGELVIGGPSVFIGYWNDEKLTNSKLTTLSFCEGNFYKTGDLSLRNPAGEIEFIGRKDKQVKLRGYRIELDEINAVVQLDPLVTNSFTALVNENLVVWVVAKGLRKEDVMTACKAQLPAYMIPNAIFVIDELPMNQNGKVAIDLLPTLDSDATEILSPSSEDEQKILQLWNEILGRTIVDLNVNFYNLGGHSLKLIQLKAAYYENWNVELSLGELFQAVTPLEHIQLIRAASQSQSEMITAATLSIDYPVSPTQQTIWLASGTEAGSIAYNIPAQFELKEAVNASLLEEAIAKTVERHEILRTVFLLNENASIRQIIQPFNRKNIQLVVETTTELVANDCIQLDIQKPFDLEKGPLIRTKLFELEKNRFVFYYCIHHLIGDATSLQLIEKEVLEQYQALVSQEELLLPQLAIQYKDYSVWLLEQLNSANIEPHRNYWKKRLSGDLQRLELATELTRTALKTYNGKAISITFNKELSQALNAYSTQNGLGLFTILLASWNVLFYRYTSQRDLLIGTPVSIRERQELQNQLGDYLQTLPLRSTLDPERSFSDYCKEIQSDLLNDLEHSIYPFDSIVHDLGLATDPSHSPLLDIFFTLQYLEEQQFEPFIEGEVRDEGTVSVKFDIDINMQQLGETLRCTLSYNTDVYDTPLMVGLIQHFNTLLANLLNRPNESVFKINYFEQDDKPTLNTNEIKVYQPETIIEQFHQQVAKTPDLLAVFDQELKLSYDQLNQMANHFASYLYHNHSLGINDRVIIQLTHSAVVVAVMLALKKLGAIYVPVDIDTPNERVTYIYTDSQSKLIINSEQLQLMELSESRGMAFPELSATPETLEFIVYTSGSTGNPKGVMITSKNIQNRLKWMWETYPFTNTDSCCAKTSLSFVDHIWEIFGPLLSGVPLSFFTKDEILNIPHFIEKLSNQRITRIILVPSLLKAMIQFPDLCAQKLTALNLWISSGEALEEALVEDFYAIMRRPDVKLLNIYGSTELTADATYYDTSAVYNPYNQFALFAQSQKEEVDDIIASHDRFLKTHNKGFQKGIGLDFKDVSLEKQWDKKSYMRFLKEVVAKDVINVSHPSYIGHMTGPAPTFFREMNALITVLNQNLVKIETSGIASNIERQVIGIFHNLVFQNKPSFYEEHVQHPNTCLGIVTNGGTLSNISALSYSLNKQLKADENFNGVTEEGLIEGLKHYGYKKVVVLGSKWCHYSIGKALKMTGLGKQSFIELDYDSKTEETITDELTHLIVKLKKEKTLILGLVAVAGTTEGGMVEPLTLLGSIARQHQVHFHVDAAFGGSFLVDETLRQKLVGIELADTVTICAHKQFYLPIGLSLCLFSDPYFAESSENNTHYQARKDSFDLGKFTIEGSRNFMSLLLHGAFQLFGIEGFASVVRNNYNNAQRFANLVQNDPAFELMYQPDLNIVLYRYVPGSFRGKTELSEHEIELVNQLNQTIQQQQFEAGNTFVSYTKVKNPKSGFYQSWFRTVFMNPYSTTRNFIQVLEDQKKLAAILEGTAYTPSSVALKKHVPIGKSLDNVEAFILDEFQQPVAIGIPGEICFAGNCVTTGYLNLDDQTTERYVDNPFGEGKLFKTGDIGKWLADGNISYLGRRDHQIKIHGYRIELDEISIKTRMIAGVEDTLIYPQEINGKLEIVAYLIGNTLDTEAVKKAWTKMLPHYMIPSRVLLVESFPLTSSGKIDRKQLPVISDLPAEIKIPETPLEREIHQIWQEVLGEKDFGVTTDFFSLGGHSLNVAQLLNRFNKSFKKHITISELFQSRTIEEQALLVEEASDKSIVVLQRAPEQHDYPLSPNQNGIWALSMSKDASTAYNMCYSVSLKGNIEIRILKEALLELANRHEILRTSFKTDVLSGEVRQMVHATVIPSDFLFNTSAEATEPKEELLTLNQYEHRFNNPCLWKVGIWKIKDDEVLFGLNIHHIIADGWSIEILMRDIFQLYLSLQTKQEVKLKPLVLNYKDVAFYQYEQLQSPKYNRHRAYWLDRYSNDIPLIELPTQFSRPAIKSYNGADVFGIFEADLTQKLTNLCKEGQATLFMGLMMLTQGFLYKYTGQNRLVIGAPVSGRDQLELEDQIGYYVKTVAFLTDFRSEWNANQLLESAKTVVLEGLEHADYGLDELIKELQLTPDLSRSPLFDVMLVVKNENEVMQQVQSSIDGIEVLPVDLENTFAKYDLTFVFNEINDHLIFSLEYNTDLFTPAFMEDMCAKFIVFANLFLDANKPALKDQCLLDQQTIQTLTETFNQTDFNVNLDDSIGQQLSRSFIQNSDKIGLLFEDKKFTYSVIQQHVDRISELLQTTGIKEGMHVAVLIDRSEWSVFTMLAIYSLVAVYVPIDTALPDERIWYILENSKAALVIVDEHSANRLGELDLSSIVITQFERVEAMNIQYPTLIDPASTSYIIYTSGSTGNPKGVAQTYKMLQNLMSWNLHESGLLHEQKFLSFASFGFDSSLNDILFCLLSNGSVHLVNEQGRHNFQELKRWILDAGIETISMPYSALKAFFEEFDAVQLEGHLIKTIISTGEQLFISGGLRQFLLNNPSIDLHNFYGPSETHVVTASRFNGSEDLAVKAPIGKPVYNTYIRILDKDMNLVPIGVNGQLYIGGWNLANGYFGNAEMTNEKFVIDPFLPGSLMYTSGDLARWLPSGELEYIQRIDGQLKIRGFRVEIGEIETKLNDLEGVNSGVVHFLKINEQLSGLAAYYLTSDSKTPQDIRVELQRVLPDYMVPTWIFLLEKFPITVNGKIDKRALPKPDADQKQFMIEYVAPENEIEQFLVDLWQDLFGIEGVGIDNNFFEMGGHSLLAVRIINRIQLKYDIKLDLKDLYLQPTIRNMAQQISMDQWLIDRNKMVETSEETENYTF